MSKEKPNDNSYSIPTQLIYGKSVSEEWDYSHHVIPPITTSSTFRLDSAQRGAYGFQKFGSPASDPGGPIYIYDRLGEPNNDMLQSSLATAEQGEIAVTFASGMAAIHAAVCSTLTRSSEVVAHQTIYGCTYSLFSHWLPRFGVDVRFADFRRPETIAKLLSDKTRIVYLESPANPTLELLDLQQIIAIIQRENHERPADQQILTIIDNTFATPYCQRPLTLGFDMVVHSLTKGIGGFGVDLGGAVVTRREFFDDLVFFRKDFGSFLSPMVAWRLLVYGLSTLALRIPKQQENAAILARYLEQHPLVERVHYPGLQSFPQHQLAQKLLRSYKGEFAPGFMIYFTLKGKTAEESRALGERLMNHIASNAYTITLAVSLGQLRTLIEHPASMTHAAVPAAEQPRLGIDPGGVRLAVGIESAEDLLNDLERSLASIR